MKNAFNLSCLLGFIFGVGSAECNSITPDEAIVVYPTPSGAVLSKDYVVTVNGRALDIYQSPVWDPGYGPSFGGPYSFAYFDLAGSAEIEITSVKPLDQVRVLPDSAGVMPRLKNGKLAFSLRHPGQLVIEPDAKNGPLLLFANPLEMNPPKPGDPGVVYFGPGIHKPEEIVLTDNQTLYIAGGAVVKGGVKASGTNIRITGRGIIDGLDWEWKKGPTAHPLGLTLCTNVKVDGIILKDSWIWNFVISGCRNVQIDNVKICSARCENNDGIGIVNSQQVKIENCFIRSDDDCITTKGFGWPERDREKNGMAVEDVEVSHCILWTDRANVWRLGCESWAGGMRRLLFHDIDVVHWDGPWLITVQPAEEMLMEDVRFEDIRVCGIGQKNLIEVYPAPTVWYRRWNTPGNVRDIVFKDMVVKGSASAHVGAIKVGGCDVNHMVKGVTFENVMRYGERAAFDSPQIRIMEHTKDIHFK